MEKEITMKDKKKDIIKAYDELLAKYKEKKKAAPAAGKEDKEVKVEKAARKTVLDVPSAHSVEGIVKGLAELKLHLSRTLFDLSDKLMAEAEKLEAIRLAIAAETQKIEDIHEIQVTAETMDALVREYEEKKRTLQEEMTAMKMQWKKEQEEHKLAVEENAANLKKERDRETEEYEYDLNLSRKRDKDAYKEEKAASKRGLEEEKEKQEKYLDERETAVAAREEEISGLKARVEAFPVELAKAIEKAEKEAAARTVREAEQKAELLVKEGEGNKKVAELTIINLKEIISNQASRIEALTEQLNDATGQVQKIANKAIDGASGIKALAAVNEIALEQAKNVSSKK